MQHNASAYVGVEFGRSSKFPARLLNHRTNCPGTGCLRLSNNLALLASASATAVACRASACWPVACQAHQALSGAFMNFVLKRGVHTRTPQSATSVPLNLSTSSELLPVRRASQVSQGDRHASTQRNSRAKACFECVFKQAPPSSNNRQ